MAWEDDKLDRERISQVFERIAKGRRKSSVFLVHADFGMGKTFFVENWQASLAERGKPVVVFDAWRNDYLESPLAGFIATFRDHLDNVEDSETRDKLTKKLGKFSRSAAPILMNTGVRVGIRLISMGAIDGDVDTLKEVFAEEGLKLTEDLSQEVVESYTRLASQKRLHVALREEFSSLVREIRSRNELPLIVLIDELDRCRPGFSLDLLEDIKHFLDVDGVCYFIFADEGILQSQAAKIFGDRASGEKYIEKFYGLRLKLPQVSARNSIFGIAEDCGFPIEEFELEYLGGLFDAFSASLRQQKRVLEFLEILFQMNSKLRDSWPIIYLLVVLREVKYENYQDVISGREVDLSGIVKYFDNPHLIWASIIFIFNASESGQISEEAARLLKKYDGAVAVFREIHDKVVTRSGLSVSRAKEKLVNSIEFAAGIRL